ncbi:MAG TPA: VOC family protein [Blastocatellia bacterium]|nr:VOC family protein [Blastocatellia bacterium]
MAIERLDHVALLTRDAGRVAQFYCEWAGMRVIHERRDPGSAHQVSWVRLAHDEAGLIIVLVESDSPAAGGRMDHFGFHVTDRAEVDQIAARARNEGILVDEPQYAGPVVGYFCTIRDPDGNLLEFSCEQLKA